MPVERPLRLESRASLWLGLIALGSAACSLSPPALAPIPAEAVREFSRARTLERGASEGWQVEASAAAERALEIAPDWVAPRRFLDDLERAALLGPDALSVHLETLERSPRDAVALYLAGRLEGPDGSPRFERAIRLDPDLGWAEHGLAWNRFLAGDPAIALRHGRRAFARARGPLERVTFAVALSRYLLALEEPADAAQLLERVLDDPDLTEGARTECLVALVRAELASEEDEALQRGFWRGVTLLESALLSEQEVAELCDELFGALDRFQHPEALSELETALARGGGKARDAQRARLFLERGANELALGLLAGTGKTEGAPRLMAPLLLELDEPAEAIEVWRSALPGRLLAEDSLPCDAVLREVVLAARAATDAAGKVALGEALIRAGWFLEAQGLAHALAREDLDAALALETRSAAGRALLGRIRSLLDRIDVGEPVVGAPRLRASASEEPAVPERSRRIESLDELLEELQVAFEHYHGGGAEDVTRSVRISYAGLASIVHPGPVFSALDEQEGRGVEGTPVGGLARELAALGRFGIFGEAVGGGGPDGTVLRRVLVEQRSGAHLGVPFRGTVVWCEGVDVPSRFARRGSPIAGAAVHEGYWIDVEGVRASLETWEELERDFLAGDDGRLERALGCSGPRVPAGAGARERARWMAPLGEGRRIALAVLAERSSSAPDEGHVTLDELLDVTALHEEGHLTDRSRFLPLLQHPLRALGLLFSAGFTPARVALRLEYRAQLVALCEAADPRIALAECLDVAEADDAGTPHAGGYRELVEDLLLELDGDLASYPALDPERYLVYQLHRLSAEDVRRAALALARTNSMVAE